MRRSLGFQLALFIAFTSLVPPRAGIARADTGQQTGTEIVPWSDLGARAAAQCRADELTVSATDNGARLSCTFQKIDGQVSSEGLWLISTESTSCEDRFRAVAVNVGRMGRDAGACRSPRLLGRRGTVEVAARKARFVRPGLVEEYSVSPDGVRQDFVVMEPPAGKGALRVALAVEGASVQGASYGARLTLEHSGREIAYSRLRVKDANGLSLKARIETSSATEMAIVVEDENAAYPIQIDPTFSDADWVSLGTLAGADNTVRAIAVGSGGALYIGGSFVGVGDVLVANRVAKWNGSAWSALGAGVGTTPGEVINALALSGTDLYVGGFFSTAGGAPASCIAKWDGTGWSALGSGIGNSPASPIVNALAVSGTDVYVGGQFTLAGGSPASRIAKWNGSAWSALGAGTSSNVFALAVSGSDLYVGGSFTSPANRVAKWDGSAWSALDGGVNNTVNALAVSGSDLYAGGAFTTAGGNPANRVAKWNGTAWSALDGGVNSTVNALVVSGTDVYAGGAFTNAGGNPANRVAKWNGSAWSAPDGGVNNTVFALALSGTDLCVGGQFASAGGSPARRIAKWDGIAWSAFGSIAGAGLDNPVDAIAVSGSDIYVGGFFSTAGSTQLNNVGKWDGSTWSALGTGTNGQVIALVVSGTDLYAGGFFTTAGGNSANGVAKWDGSAWSALGAGVGPTALVLAMTTSGTDLYVGGLFSTAGGGPAANVAKWNGSAWSPLDGGVDNVVRSLAVAGSDLYVGGDFLNAGGAPASRVAKWNGSAWSALGSGIGPSNALVLGLVVSGADLYTGGAFSTAGGGSASNIAKWDGSAWSAVGGGADGAVRAMAMSGTDLYVGGDFSSVGGNPARHVAKWDGSVWSALGSGTNNQVAALAVSGSDLYVGGTFSAAGDKISAYIAKLGPGVGSVAGHVLADCPSASSPLLGVRVDAYEVGSGDLVATVITDAGGGYLIENLPAGDYVLTVVNPLGYTATAVEVPVTVLGGQTVSGDFALHCQAIIANPRSIGFWKHEVGVATGGKGAAQISAAALCSYLDLIAAHFNDNAVNPVVVYLPPVSGTCADKLEVARQLLNLTGSVAMKDRAKQQLMSLLLNVAAGYISQTQVISSDGRVVSQAITYCDNLIDSPSGDYEKAKTIADLINNGQPVPAGTIPASTPVIPYRSSPAPELFSLGLERISPNPVHGAFTVNFAVSRGAAVLEMIDVAGRRVFRQEVGQLGAGRHSIAAGNRASFAPGVYTVRLTQAGSVVNRTVVVLR